MQLLFTKMEQFLIRNQRKPFVLTQKIEQTNDLEGENSSELEPDHIEFGPDDVFSRKLVRGLYPRLSSKQASTTYEGIKQQVFDDESRRKSMLRQKTIQSARATADSSRQELDFYTENQLHNITTKVKKGKRKPKNEVTLNFSESDPFKKR